MGPNSNPKRVSILINIKGWETTTNEHAKTSNIISKKKLNIELSITRIITLQRIAKPNERAGKRRTRDERSATLLKIQISRPTTSRSKTCYPRLEKMEV